MKSFLNHWSILLLTLLTFNAAAFPAHHHAHARNAEVEATTLETDTALEVRQSSAAMRSVLYYTNWSIYGRNYQPQNLSNIIDHVTHILYSFANVHPDTGAVYLSDTYADTDKHYPTDSWNDVGTNVYGCVKQFYLYKKQNRKLKVLLSIGGWTYSSNFASPMGTDAGRQTFVSSAVQLLEDLGLDGIDIDWEYPANSTDANNYVTALKMLRAALDAAAAKRGNGTKFLITAAVAAGPSNYQNYLMSQMNQYLDFWNLMAYDYAGSWAQPSGHQANLYKSTSNPGATPFNTDDAINYYTSHGVPANKMVMGMPLYGRAFEQTAGPGQSYNGVGGGSWENGIWDYKALPKAGATENMDKTVGASWSYDANAKEMISYDTVAMSTAKAQYVKSKGLGGGMWWEASGDKAKGAGSLVENWVNGVGGVGSLETSQNCLSYPNSKYDNIKNNMA